jgi:hypothetical protein
MKIISGLMLLFVLFGADGKKFKIYKCQQADGTVVTQDRRCEVTRLQQPKLNKNVVKPVIKPNSPRSSSPKKVRKKVARTVGSNNQRSPYFTFGWDQIIPKNWLLRKEEFASHHQLLLSKTKFTGSRDFNSGLKLAVYPQTNRTMSEDAFAKALTIYHQIRERYSNQLINSHFKTHNRYKIFNIEYKIDNTIYAFTEFYIDEDNNDLFVLTIQSPQNKWQQHQVLAEKIFSHL